MIRLCRQRLLVEQENPDPAFSGESLDLGQIAQIPQGQLRCLFVVAGVRIRLGLRSDETPLPHPQGYGHRRDRKADVSKQQRANCLIAPQLCAKRPFLGRAAADRVEEPPLLRVREQVRSEWPPTGLRGKRLGAARAIGPHPPGHRRAGNSKLTGSFRLRFATPDKKHSLLAEQRLLTSAELSCISSLHEPSVAY